MSEIKVIEFVHILIFKKQIWQINEKPFKFVKHSQKYQSQINGTN